MLLDGAKRMLDHFIETTQQFIRVPNIDEFLFVDIRGEFYSPSLTGMTHYGVGELELTVHVKGVQYVVSKLNFWPSAMQIFWFSSRLKPWVLRYPNLDIEPLRLAL